MGLKKLFSTKDKHDKDGLKSYKNNRRDSTISLTKTISSWGQKEKDKLKHQSSGSSSADSSHNISTHNNKRFSEPSPAASSVSLSHQLPPTRENKVTQNYDQQQKTVQQQRHNPFSNASPVTPSGSMRDVNNVVNVLRNSMSSEASLSTFDSTTGQEEKKHARYNTSQETLNTTIPVAIKEEQKEDGSTNPFVQKRHEKPTIISQVSYPPPMRFSNDSNKYELFDDEYHNNNNEHNNNDAPITPPDSAKNETNSQDDNESLYAELLAIQHQLDAVNPNNAVDIRNRLDGVNHLLTKALDNSTHLETRLKSIIDTSKQTIIAINEENKVLKETDETTKAELEQIKQQHQEIKEQRQGQLTVYQDLKDQHADAIKENQDLLQEIHDLSSQLDQHIATRENASLLLNNGKETDEKEKEAGLQDKLKKIIALSASSQLLNKQLEGKLQNTTTQHAQELEALKQTYEAETQQHLESKKQELIALETAKDQQAELKQHELLDLQTKLEAEKNEQLESKHQELLALQIKMDTDTKTLESSHQSEIQALEQEQKEKHEVSLLQLRTESDEHVATLEKKHQTEIQDIQTKFEQEQQQKLEALQNEHEKVAQELKTKAENDIAALEEQYQSKMKALEVKYTGLITDVTNDMKQEQEKWQQKETEYTTRIESLEKSISDDKLELESCTAHIKKLEEENDQIKGQIDILKSDTSDDVQKVAQDNITYKQELKEKEALEKEHVISVAAVTAELAELTKTLESTKEENLGLQSKLDETQKQFVELQSSKEASDKGLKERIQMINEQSAQSLIEVQQQHETKSLAAEKECQQLRDQLVEMEQVSREAAKSVIDENERLENRLRQMEESSQLAIHENVALNEEVELLSKSTSRRTIVSENQQLKNELKVMNNIRQENLNLNELVECLQAKVKELSMEDGIVANSSSGSGNNNNQQDELMLMHTRAQLGLIEYLEGEDDVSLAMSKFKKQLEAEMREFASTISKNNIEPIPSVSESERMR